MICKHYNFELTEEDRHYVKAKEYNNCVLCVAEENGPMTQDKVAKYLGITKMRVSQIEKQALRQFFKKNKIIENPFTLFGD